MVGFLRGIVFLKLCNDFYFLKNIFLKKKCFYIYEGPGLSSHNRCGINEIIISQVVNGCENKIILHQCAKVQLCTRY